MVILNTALNAVLVFSSKAFLTPIPKTQTITGF